MSDVPPTKSYLDPRDKELEELNKQIDDHMEEWHKNQLDPSMITIPHFMMDMMIKTTARLLKDHLGLNDKDMDIEIKKTFLETAQALLPGFMEQKRQAEILGGIQQQMMPPDILGPNGYKMN